MLQGFPVGSKARRVFCGVVGQPRKPLPRVRLVLDPAAAPVRAPYTRRTEPPARPWLREARLAAIRRWLRDPSFRASAPAGGRAGRAPWHRA